MNLFLDSMFSILFQAFGVALLAVLVFRGAKSIYKPFFTKNKVNLVVYIITGLLVCLGASLALGYDDTPPCLETEYDTRGSHCVQYDDSAPSKTFSEKVGSSGRYFGIIFPTFLFFVYKAKKEPDYDYTGETSE
ncbi:MAG: hypothetical protein WD963_02325 [Candidatus Paceibacterota bacterium]